MQRLESDPRSFVPTDACCVRLRIGGRVQGVGFRPFVFGLAQRMGVTGSVRNVGAEVEIEAAAQRTVLDAFVGALIAEAPAVAQPRILALGPATANDVSDFRIEGSVGDARSHARLAPDFDTCSQCLDELRDPRDRRFRYPFINCTQCGPRYTLITALPYDRARTAMGAFPLCAVCLAEYRSPAERRFHAEPLACPTCGPKLHYRAATQIENETQAALAAAVNTLRSGGIVAVKGVGGYHLLCDACDDDAVARLRSRKQRPHKPLAVLFGCSGADELEQLHRHCHVHPAAAAQLRDPVRPVVLLPRRKEVAISAGAGTLAPLVAPGLDYIGCLLPYSPLHHLLSSDFGSPLVATSANVTGEPVFTDEADAEARLTRIADAFLHHDRPILRPADDSVIHLAAREARTLRLGRGLAPLEWDAALSFSEPVLAVGGHIKNTVALGWDQRLVISPHIGDLDSPRSRDLFARTIADLQTLYGVRARYCVHDMHSGYASSRWAAASGLTTIAVQHHCAHAAALAGEYPQEPRWLVFTWDGTGLGDDGTLWGGEALLGRPGAWRRVASLRPFFLPGGDRAGRQPWRSAAALCWEADLPCPTGLVPDPLVRGAWERRLNSPQSSAAGRLFDAAAALLGLVRETSFEAQGPMLLEAVAEPDRAPMPLRWNQDNAGIWRCDWAPLLPMLCDGERSPGERAGRLHASLAGTLCDIARTLRSNHGDFAVGLSGGVFQNRHLLERAVTALTACDLRTYVPARVPCNDGGLSFGQLVEARAVLAAGAIP